jgi:hypothetical protein
MVARHDWIPTTFWTISLVCIIKKIIHSTIIVRWAQIYKVPCLVWATWEICTHQTYIAKNFPTHLKIAISTLISFKYMCLLTNSFLFCCEPHGLWCSSPPPLRVSLSFIDGWYGYGTWLNVHELPVGLGSTMKWWQLNKRILASSWFQFQVTFSQFVRRS